MKPMPPEVADELERLREIARTYVDMQRFSLLHTINTGRVDRYPPGVFADACQRGLAALDDIIRIKGEYS